MRPLEDNDININPLPSPSATETHVQENTGLEATNTFLKSADTPDFSTAQLQPGIDFSCPINADDISNRWLSSYILVPGKQQKVYSAPITAFICQILKSYAAAAVNGRSVPPFVHFSQTKGALTNRPLATCLTLVRMSEEPLRGTENVVADILRREMSKIYEQHDAFDHVDLLAAFQAYLIYSLVLFFRLNQSSSLFLREAMINLQGLACASSRKGLMCTAEQQHARPPWEAWILAEAKRRTLYTMYLFDSVLSARDGLPTMLGTELTGLPAPCSRFLWRALTRPQWETNYNTYLVDWKEGLCINELWPVPDDMDEAGLSERRRRVDQWLEGVDEYGTMLYAVTSCTHGELILV